jgi:hypothetical protein
MGYLAGHDINQLLENDHLVFLEQKYYAVE